MKDHIDIEPADISYAIDEIKPAVISVRDGNGDELTITNMSIVVRPNGIHLLLDCPEAIRYEE